MNLMHEKLLLILAMLFIVLLLVMLARRMRIAYPIFLVLAGLAIGFIPGMPGIEIDPELIFLIFLPPLLYEAAWYTSWKEFKKWKTAIGLLAFGLVFLTSFIVAYSTVALVPGFTLAMGFLLGGIISPPDAVAATTVLKGLKVPRRSITILEGESLVNDASSLIVFRFALAAILTGTFSLHEATWQFFLVAGMGVVVGLAGGHVMYLIHRFLPTTPAIDTTLTVMTPYILFLSAEHFHFSGVMAVVSGGLFMSFRAHEVFTTGGTRINMTAVWHTIIFVMNTLVFILIGLSLPGITKNLGEISIFSAIRYGLIISLITIVIRLVWVYFIIFFRRLLNIGSSHRAPVGWKNPLIIGWAGMRGVVSLATALSIPLFMTNGNAFPNRNLIIFITFVVILVTLVFQGLTLPLIIRLTKIIEMDPVLPEHQQRTGISLELDKIALDYLRQNASGFNDDNTLIRAFSEKLQHEINGNQRYLESIEFCTNKIQEREEYQIVMKKIHSLQRKALFRMKNQKTFTDDAIRNAEHALDLNDLKLSDPAG